MFKNVSSISSLFILFYDEDLQMMTASQNQDICDARNRIKLKDLARISVIIIVIINTFE